MFIVKNSELKNNYRTDLEKWFFQSNFQCQKRSRAIQGIQGIPEQFGTLKTLVMYGIACIQPVIFYPPKGSPVLLEIVPPPPPCPHKANFEIFQPHTVIYYIFILYNI